MSWILYPQVLSDKLEIWWRFKQLLCFIIDSIISAIYKAYFFLWNTLLPFLELSYSCCFQLSSFFTVLYKLKSGLKKAAFFICSLMYLFSQQKIAYTSSSWYKIKQYCLFRCIFTLVYNKINNYPLENTNYDWFCDKNVALEIFSSF